MDVSNSGPVRRPGVPNRVPSAQQSSAKAPYPFNLTRFYNMNDSPWVPQGIITGIPPDAQHGQHVSGSVGFHSTGPSFQNYRSRPLASECDTCNEDSGYAGSGAPYSIEATSVYEEDQNLEAQNTAQLIESFHLDAGQISSSAQPSPWTQPRPTPSSVATAPASGGYKHYCSPCDTWLKTRSELNKHSLRHSKPFLCEALDCHRSEGFSTKNDLDRHKRSVHSDLSVSGPRYICPLDQCAAKGQPKLWPRADNFRSHLRRIHQKKLTHEDDLQEYLYRPLLRRDDLEGVGGTALSYMNANEPSNIRQPVGHLFPQSYFGDQSIATASRHGIPDLHNELDSILQNSTRASPEKGQAGLVPAQEGDNDFLRPNIVRGTGQRPLHSSRSFDSQMTSLPDVPYPYTHANHASATGDIELSMDNDDDSGALDDDAESSERGEEQRSTPQTDVIHSKGFRAIQPEPERSDIKMVDAEQEQPKSTPRGSSHMVPVSVLDLPRDVSVLEYLKTLPKELLKEVLDGETNGIKATSSSQDLPNQKNQYPCTECNKKFGRPCELKKHKKRHEKPYGCTVIHCTKSFGSKNDWKRHESSQHWQLESWKCEEMKANQTEPCDKVCPRRESFKNHLHKEHMMTNPKEIEEKLERCRIGRHCDDRFWCGFCSDVIEITGEGVNAWTKRCDHIDDHFSGRDGKQKMNISEWVHLDDKDQSCSVGGRQSNTKPSTPDSDVSSTLKRKPSGEAETMTHKKQRQEMEYMWTCVSWP
ncbi:hypothetical protein B0J13DRAFT_302844 [Dactylonectria estremocensis]|uniref:C2H2-type domain-containing protein n=1 Tax=Dactylonectria estremocensis TaxID=1079267 RepID=A0A9P9F006_9HYPO|nr:hypothetical protein B0J13DRAFT_302844 [Dactylonectria estremocensis]